MIALSTKKQTLISIAIIILVSLFFLIDGSFHYFQNPLKAISVSDTDGVSMDMPVSRLYQEYQIAQLQRLIAENNEAIALAKRNAAQATAETLKLLGNLSSATQPTSAPKKLEPATNGYELIFTGPQDDGNWKATLKKNDKTYDVAIGKQLPDGAKVISIDDTSVLLSRDNGASKELITFSGEMAMKPAEN